ncbi:MAG: 50S ribosomal protein L32 [Candidatus Peregrinibacteria bacterium GW2011_GWF2_43_17]|nr:MAG: 50S ribosomal protein L32 [Candidatus Peregrinibacteria bacterium GW2011_GWF2_43_17]KKT20242.1 MAG: 50S ribosomal protein L32 [Candidatus Peregrinibacteria bacterium GW2011_GWA2_43_8]HAU39802.1 50S ribosomal protein L32 [Candidatus Peregrinibacteria bacterium]
MAKHPVPKRKTEKSRTKRRYHQYVNRVITKLEEGIRLVDCPSCGESMVMHHMCASCGKHRGKDMIDKSKELSKITKIKA